MRVIVSSNPAPRYPGIQTLLREESMAGMLDGKVALVTGGGGGIGRATALAMVREGARVAVADFVAAAARDTVAQINAQGGQAVTLTALGVDLRHGVARRRCRRDGPGHGHRLRPARLRL